MKFVDGVEKDGSNLVILAYSQTTCDQFMPMALKGIRRYSASTISNQEFQRCLDLVQIMETSWNTWVEYLGDYFEGKINVSFLIFNFCLGKYSSTFDTKIFHTHFIKHWDVQASTKE